MSKKIERVLNGYIDEERNVCVIDAYPKDEEGDGFSVAEVCLDTGKVFFRDLEYQHNELVKNSIKEVLEKNHLLPDETKKPVFVIINTRDGEEETSNRHHALIPKDKDLEEYAEEVCSTFWSNNEEDVDQLDEEEGYTFFGYKYCTVLKSMEIPWTKYFMACNKAF